MKYKNTFLTFFSILLSTKGTDLKNNTQPIVVFIHGTHQTLNLLTFKNTFLEKYCNHKKGLFSLEKCNPKYVYSNVLKSIVSKSHNFFKPENSYLFCWSGKLDQNERKEAAKKLYSELTTLKKQNPEKDIIIFAHSHGANVALHLAEHRKNEDGLIEKLILLACPVQKATKEYIHSPLFKKIIAAYSKWDMIQILDPQGFDAKKLSIKRPFFSERTFNNDTKKLYHIKITRYKVPIFHLGFLLPSCTRHYATIAQLSDIQLLKTKTYEIS